MSPAAYTIRPYQPGDEQGILEAFNRIFARVDPGFVPRKLEEWRWLYERNPSGTRIWLAITPEGRVLAQYAGIPQRARVEGEPTSFSQSVDSMSDPEARRLAREPLFVQVGRIFDATFGGEGPEKDMLMWGLPVPAAYRIGRRSLKYELVRQQHKLCAAPERLELASTGDTAEELRAFPPGTDELFARFAAGRSALAVRDRAQLAWRFEQHPLHRYRIAGVRRAGALAALAVFRKGAFDQAEDGLLVDWIVPAEDEDARAALLAWCAEAARAEGCARLTAVFPDSAPEWPSFQRHGFRVHATRYFLVGWSFSPSHDLEWLARNWYYTLGDTDLA